MLQFAKAAVVHAQERHGLTLEYSRQGVAVVDQVLDDERAHGDGQDLDPLALCYGSWLGELAVEQLSAQWVGMYEPHPPRLQVAGVLCSPIEAVARRLKSVSEPPLIHRLQEMLSWVQNVPSRDTVVKQNQHAWDELSCDPKFVQFKGSNAFLIDPAAAHAAIDPWLKHLPLPGCKLLCLAAGGGAHSVIHAVGGFDVTVVDLSPRMLAIDQELAAAYHLPIATLAASMDNLSALGDASFDCVLQPVSACYVPDLLPVYAEVARVLRDGGRYVVQHKQPASLQASGAWSDEGYRIVQRAFAGQRAGSGATSERHLEPGVAEFIHPLGVLLGGLCQSGFVIEDFQEPSRADAWALPSSDQHRACYLPPYLKIKARRGK